MPLRLIVCRGAVAEAVESARWDEQQVPGLGFRFYHESLRPQQAILRMPLSCSALSGGDPTREH